MAPAFSCKHLFKQEDWSDVDIVFTMNGHAADDPVESRTGNLIRVPGHRAILSNSPYCREQVRPAAAAWRTLFAVVMLHLTPGLNHLPHSQGEVSLMLGLTFYAAAD